MTVNTHHPEEPADALDDLPEALARFAKGMTAAAETVRKLQAAHAALAAVWALKAEDLAPGIHKCLYEADDDAWGPEEDPTTLDAAQAALTPVWSAIASHIDPNAFTTREKD